MAKDVLFGTPIISDKHLEHFSDPPPPFIWTSPFLIFKLSVGPPSPYFRIPPIIWNWRVGINLCVAIGLSSLSISYGLLDRAS